ncbi:Syd protein [Streptomyces sp. NBRC 110611]|nr:Syd protein [Streptomyces sp. NBRC 110611]
MALVAAGVVAAKEWQEKAGPKAAVALSGAYVAAFVGSHVLAKKIGAWPSVFAVAGGMALASWAVVDRRG